MTLDEIRQRYPQAAGMSDTEILGRISEAKQIPLEKVAYDFGVQINEPGFGSTVKRTFGQMGYGLGRAAEDFLPGMEDNALMRGSEDLMFRNPSGINSLDDVLAHPGLALQEGLGNAVTFMGPAIVARGLGAGLSAYGAARAAPMIGAAGRALGGLPGQTVIAGLPSYGGIRQTQDETGEGSIPGALLGAGAVGLIEQFGGPQRYLYGGLGRAAMGKSALGTFGRELGRNVLQEAGEELVQNPIEQYAGGLDPTQAKQIEETLLGGVMGGIGGLIGAPGAAYAGLQHRALNQAGIEGILGETWDKQIVRTDGPQDLLNGPTERERLMQVFENMRASQAQQEAAQNAQRPVDVGYFQHLRQTGMASDIDLASRPMQEFPTEQIVDWLQRAKQEQQANAALGITDYQTTRQMRHAEYELGIRSGQIPAPEVPAGVNLQPQASAQDQWFSQPGMIPAAPGAGGKYEQKIASLQRQAMPLRTRPQPAVVQQVTPKVSPTPKQRPAAATPAPAKEEPHPLVGARMAFQKAGGTGKAWTNMLVAAGAQKVGNRYNIAGVDLEAFKEAMQQEAAKLTGNSTAESFDVAHRMLFGTPVVYPQETQNEQGQGRAAATVQEAAPRAAGVAQGAPDGGRGIQPTQGTGGPSGVSPAPQQQGPVRRPTKETSTRELNAWLSLAKGEANPDEETQALIKETEEELAARRAIGEMRRKEEAAKPKGKANATPKQGPVQGVQGQERPEVGLRQVAEGNAGGTQAAPAAQAVEAEKVAPKARRVTKTEAAAKPVPTGRYVEETPQSTKQEKTDEEVQGQETPEEIAARVGKIRAIFREAFGKKEAKTEKEKKNAERDFEMLLAFLSGDDLVTIGNRHGMTESGVSKAIGRTVGASPETVKDHPEALAIRVAKAARDLGYTKEDIEALFSPRKVHGESAERLGFTTTSISEEEMIQAGLRPTGGMKGKEKQEEVAPVEADSRTDEELYNDVVVDTLENLSKDLPQEKREQIARNTAERRVKERKKSQEEATKKDLAALEARKKQEAEEAAKKAAAPPVDATPQLSEEDEELGEDNWMSENDISRYIGDAPYIAWKDLPRDAKEVFLHLVRRIKAGQTRVGQAQESRMDNLQADILTSLAQGATKKIGGLFDKSLPDPTRYSTGEALGRSDKKGLEKALRGFLFTPRAFDKLVTVVQSQKELPKKVIDDAIRQNILVVKGATHNGRVYIVADNVAPEQAFGVLLHELGVHYGLRTILGAKRLAALAEKIDGWAGKNDGSIESKLAQYAVKMANGSAEEKVAYFVEAAALNKITPKTANKRLSGVVGWLRQLWDAVTSFLRARGIDMSKVTMQDMVDFAYGGAWLGTRMHPRESAMVGVQYAVRTLSAFTKDAKTMLPEHPVWGDNELVFKSETDIDTRAKYELIRESMEDGYEYKLDTESEFSLAVALRMNELEKSHDSYGMARYSPLYAKFKNGGWRQVSTYSQKKEAQNIIDTMFDIIINNKENNVPAAYKNAYRIEGDKIVFLIDDLLDIHDKFNNNGLYAREELRQQTAGLHSAKKMGAEEIAVVGDKKFIEFLQEKDWKKAYYWGNQRLMFKFPTPEGERILAWVPDFSSDGKMKYNWEDVYSTRRNYSKDPFNPITSAIDIFFSELMKPGEASYRVGRNEINLPSRSRKAALYVSDSPTWKKLDAIVVQSGKDLIAAMQERKNLASKNMSPAERKEALAEIDKKHEQASKQHYKAMQDMHALRERFVAVNAARDKANAKNLFRLFVHEYTHAGLEKAGVDSGSNLSKELNSFLINVGDPKMAERIVYAQRTLNDVMRNPMQLAVFAHRSGDEKLRNDLLKVIADYTELVSRYKDTEPKPIYDEFGRDMRKKVEYYKFTDEGAEKAEQLINDALQDGRLDKMRDTYLAEYLSMMRRVFKMYQTHPGELLARAAERAGDEVQRRVKAGENAFTVIQDVYSRSPWSFADASKAKISVYHKALKYWKYSEENKAYLLTVGERNYADGLAPAIKFDKNTMSWAIMPMKVEITTNAGGATDVFEDAPENEQGVLAVTGFRNPADAMYAWNAELKGLWKASMRAKSRKQSEWEYLSLTGDSEFYANMISQTIQRLNTAKQNEKLSEASRKAVISDIEKELAKYKKAYNAAEDRLASLEARNTEREKEAVALWNQRAQNPNYASVITAGLDDLGAELAAEMETSFSSGDEAAPIVERRIPEIAVTSRQVSRVAKTLGRKALLPLLFGHDLVNYIGDTLPAAKAYFQSMQDKINIRERIELKIKQIATDFTGFSPGVQKEANAFIMDSTMQQKWGFQPEWLGAVVVDDDMRKRFEALDPDMQKVIKDVFRTNEELFYALEDAVAASATKASLKFKRTKLDGPYASLMRFGDYAVIWKSDAYIEAEGRGAKKEIEKLETDPAHYRVQFVSSALAAERTKAKMESELGGLADHGELDWFRREFEDKITEMPFQAVRRLQAAIEKGPVVGEKYSKEMQDRLTKMSNQLYVASLASMHARKSELHRRRVVGAEPDMMRSFVAHASAMARLVASVEVGDKMADSLQEMRTQAREGKLEERNKKMQVLNEILARHSALLNANDTPWQDSIMLMNSFYTLLTSPAYWMSNTTQPFVMTLPKLAGDHSMGRAWKALITAYKEVSDAIEFKKGRFDPTKVQNTVYKESDALDTLLMRGNIDITINQDIGDLSDGVYDQFNKMRWLTGNLRKIPHNIEMVNRVASAVAAYRLEFVKQRQANKSEEEAHAAAVEYANSIVQDTHGNYGAANAPRLLMQGNKALPVKMMGQFRKFQLIQAALLVKTFNQMFDKGLNPDQRRAARKTMLWLVTNYLTLGGLTGLPAGALLVSALGMLFGDDDDQDDEVVLTRAIGDRDMARLILRGVPAALGADVSKRLGAGSVFSLLPFAETDPDAKKTFTNYVMAALGPAVGTAGRFADGLGLMLKGQYWKGLEQMSPVGVTNVARGLRFATEGVTSRRGDLYMDPEEVGVLSSMFQMVGLPTTAITERQWKQRAVTAYTEHFHSEASRIKSEYVRGTADERAQARKEWKELQEARVKNGFTRQPLSELLKAPQETKKRVAKFKEGVPTTKENARFFATM